MVVNSLAFALFFVIVFVGMFCPWTMQSARRQNAWLLISSYAFYAMADWRMVPLLMLATGVFYWIGHKVHNMVEHQSWRAASSWTTIGVVMGVALLLVFKYLDFLGQSFAAMFSAAGLRCTWTTLHIVVPVGVSFFTFKLISYVIELHRQRIAPARDLLQFATYIAFFPTLMSGPIDRPGKFLPQLDEAKRFDVSKSVDGCRQVLWGLFLKMCVADNLATLTDSVWAMPESFSASRLVVAVLLFPLQLYADFGGYSHMAIGVGKVLGFDVAINFRAPFLARNIAEFWQRWHISLTTWLTDYVFMPLNIAMRDRGQAGLMLAVIVNMVLIGFWHGADWTFGLFGLYFGLLYIPLIVRGKFGKKKRIKAGAFGLPKGSDLMCMVSTYCLVAMGFMLFKADTVAAFVDFCGNIARPSLLSVPSLGLPAFTYIGLAMLVGCEWLCRDREHPLQFVHGPAVRSRALRWIIYYVLILCIFLFQGETQQFIYFQF